MFFLFFSKLVNSLVMAFWLALPGLLPIPFVIKVFLTCLLAMILPFVLPFMSLGPVTIPSQSLFLAASIALLLTTRSLLSLLHLYILLLPHSSVSQFELQSLRSSSTVLQFKSLLSHSSVSQFEFFIGSWNKYICFQCSVVDPMDPFELAS